MCLYKAIFRYYKKLASIKIRNYILKLKVNLLFVTSNINIH